jgi:hypothetical protein
MRQAMMFRTLFRSPCFARRRAEFWSEVECASATPPTTADLLRRSTSPNRANTGSPQAEVPKKEGRLHIISIGTLASAPVAVVEP